MRITFSLQRFDPERDHAPHQEEFRLDVAWRSTTVLDALIRIRQEVDPTVAFRHSCRSAICGSCSMVINGRHTLACKTLIGPEIERHGPTITVAPMRNLPVLKDLAVRMEPFWQKVRAVTPWLEQAGGASSTAQAVLTKETRSHLHNVDACILCGACVSSCSSLEVSPGFLGPAALAKAYRFVADPRDGARSRRLTMLTQPDGVWDCTRCNMCVEVCPKDVQPMEAIVRLRRAAITDGLTDTIGARHITSFTEIVRQEGRLNEGRLPAQMLWRHPAALLAQLPLAIKMFVRGKVPLPWHPPLDSIRAIRRLFGRWGTPSSWTN
ncbi:MAG: succinate dehydrogenase/fumarate reductase iron-sulfur subunit [Nitrospirae bacterium]|nr:succinate dehydrogenase/fumarate reductase iron-sulfur subunit [Nitrospirota bacterium]